MSGETREREFCNSYWKSAGAETLQREVEGKPRPALPLIPKLNEDLFG